MKDIKVGIIEKLGYGSIHLSANLLVSFVNMLILFYFTDVFGISPAVAGAVIAFGLIWDGINDPLIAHYGDNHRFKNGERSRPYMLYFCMPLAIATVLMFSPFALSQNMKVAYIILIYLIFYSFTTFWRLPGFTMQTLATPDLKDRLSINVFVSGGATIGAMLAGVMCWPLVRLFSGLDSGGEMLNPERGFPMTAGVIGLIIIGTSIFSYFNSKERVFPRQSNEEKISILGSFKIAIKDHNFRWNTAFSTLYFSNNTLMMATLVYYCTYVYRRPAAATMIMAVFAIGSLLALPFIKKIDLVIGRRKAMMLGGLLVFIGKIPFVIFPYNMTTMYIAALTMGLSVALNIVTFSTTRAEVADHIEYVNNRRIDSMVVNFMGFINKCGTSLTTLAIGLILQFTGYDASLAEQSHSVIIAMVIIVGWTSMAVSLLMILCGSRINIEDVVKEMKEAKYHS
ncbi:MAG: MFS transporter [Treponema sp.]|nr:MFS transporter [Treponema sp.]